MHFPFVLLGISDMFPRCGNHPKTRPVHDEAHDVPAAGGRVEKNPDTRAATTPFFQSTQEPDVEGLRGARRGHALAKEAIGSSQFAVSCRSEEAFRHVLG